MSLICCHNNDLHLPKAVAANPFTFERLFPTKAIVILMPKQVRRCTQTNFHADYE